MTEFRRLQKNELKSEKQKSILPRAEVAKKKLLKKRPIISTSNIREATLRSVLEDKLRLPTLPLIPHPNFCTNLLLLLVFLHLSEQNPTTQWKKTQQPNVLTPSLHNSQPFLHLTEELYT